MRCLRSAIVFGAVACGMAALVAGQSGPIISIDDVERFYRVYDAAQGHPTADQIQRDYLDRGTEGLHSFARARNVTAARIADAVATQPQLYADAKRCLTVLRHGQDRSGEVVLQPSRHAAVASRPRLLGRLPHRQSALPTGVRQAPGTRRDLRDHGCAGVLHG